jgi:thiamine-phosphate pyrophosphorylase
MNPCDIRLYGILDTQIARGARLAEQAAAAARGGVTLLQYRAKQAATAEMIAEARLIRAALAGTGVPLIINDRVDVALVAGAEGVHLGREDMTAADARALMGPRAIIGATIKNEADIRALQGAPVDYGCIGGVFATSHKDNPDPPVGLDGLRHLRALGRALLPGLPIGAIAGIHAGNAGDVMVAGADGIAVIGAIFAQTDPGQAARLLLERVRGV